MIIFLIGYMGSGKSTVGKKMTKKTGIKFIDMDKFFEAEKGMSVSEIFASLGEATFREMERNFLETINTEGDLIVATGGGAPCYGENMEIINSKGTSVYLKLHPEAFACRISERGREKRPLLRGMNDQELTAFVKEKLVEREPFYKKASIVLECDELTHKQMSNKIIKKLGLKVIDN